MRRIASSVKLRCVLKAECVIQPEQLSVGSSCQSEKLGTWCLGNSMMAWHENTRAVFQVPGLIPGSERCPGEGNGNPLQYSHLGNTMGRRNWQATVHRVVKEFEHDLVTKPLPALLEKKIDSPKCKYRLIVDQQKALEILQVNIWENR